MPTYIMLYLLLLSSFTIYFIPYVFKYDMYPSSQPLNTYLPYALPIDSIALHYFILMRALLKMTHVFFSFSTMLYCACNQFVRLFRR